MATYSVRELEAILHHSRLRTNSPSRVNDTYLLRVTLRESVGLQWRPSLLGRADSERYCAVVISLHQVNLVYRQRAETCRGADKRS